MLIPPFSVDTSKRFLYPWGGGVNMNTFICMHCGHSFEQEPNEKEKAFAKMHGDKTLEAIWICPKCGKDNKTTIKVAD